MCGSIFLKWVLIIQLWVVFESVVLFLPVLIMEISVEADHTTLSESLLNTGIFPSPGGVSVCFAHGRGGSSIRGMCGFSFVREDLGRRVSGYFRGKTTPSSACAAATPPREGNARFFFFEVGFNNSALGSFPECSFMPSRVDNGDFGRGRPYNVIRFSIIHRDIPLPWRGVRVQAHGRGGSFCS